MKTTLAYALVLVFSGITSAQPVCFTICPTDAGPARAIWIYRTDRYGRTKYFEGGSEPVVLNNNIRIYYISEVSNNDYIL